MHPCHCGKDGGGIEPVIGNVFLQLVRQDVEQNLGIGAGLTWRKS